MTDKASQRQDGESYVKQDTFDHNVGDGAFRSIGEEVSSLPNFLSSPPDDPPSLENVHGWDAEPLLVSGTDAYVDGEYLYQDYVYDDKGAATGDEPMPPASGAPQPVPNPSPGSHSTGRVVYPTDAERYGHNAADLLEFRTRPAEDEIAYRVTLQTMKEPAVAAIAIGIDTGGDSGSDNWGYGIGSLGDLSLDHVLVTWGTGAELNGEPLADDRVHVDVERNQLDVSVLLDAGEETWRHYAVVGLWDDAAHQLKQITDQRTAYQPGGARGENLPPVFNVAFRFEEPMGVMEIDGKIPGSPPDRDSDTIQYGQWREHAQAEALADRDISQFYTDVDFSKLRSGVTELNVPETGFFNRLYVSRFDLGEGVRKDFDESSTDRPSDNRDKYDLLRNRVQPYGLYVPHNYDSNEQHPLHVFLHGGSTSHNLIGIREEMLDQLGEQRDALMLGPEGRAPGNFYRNEGELDVLEAIVDVVARYNVDPERITISGSSMGGGGTFRLTSRYPDLFAKAFPIVGGCWPGQEPTLDSLRHVPILMWNGLVDELAPPAHFYPTTGELQKRGYRHEIDMFLEDGHGIVDKRENWGTAKAFLDGEYLGDATVERNPSHVTHTRLPEMEYEELELRHDSAYWVHDIYVANDADVGSVDVRVIIDGEAPPWRRQPDRVAGSDYVHHYSGVENDPADHIAVGTRWIDEMEPSELDNALDVTLGGVSEVTLDLSRTELNTEREITVDVETDRSTSLSLQAGGETIDRSVPAGSRRLSISFEE